MVEILFTLFLAGCADDGASCEVLESHVVAARDLAACEREIDRRLAAYPAGFPILAGICRPGPGAAAPAGWSQRGTGRASLVPGAPHL